MVKDLSNINNYPLKNTSSTSQGVETRSRKRMQSDKDKLVRLRKDRRTEYNKAALKGDHESLKKLDEVGVDIVYEDKIEKIKNPKDSKDFIKRVLTRDLDDSSDAEDVYHRNIRRFPVFDDVIYKDNDAIRGRDWIEDDLEHKREIDRSNLKRVFIVQALSRELLYTNDVNRKYYSQKSEKLSIILREWIEDSIQDTVERFVNFILKKHYKKNDDTDPKIPQQTILQISQNILKTEDREDGLSIKDYFFAIIIKEIEKKEKDLIKSKSEIFDAILKLKNFKKLRGKVISQLLEEIKIDENIELLTDKSDSDNNLIFENKFNESFTSRYNRKALPELFSHEFDNNVEFRANLRLSNRSQQREIKNLSAYSIKEGFTVVREYAEKVSDNTRTSKSTLKITSKGKRSDYLLDTKAYRDILLRIQALKEEMGDGLFSDQIIVKLIRARLNGNLQHEMNLQNYLKFQRSVIGKLIKDFSTLIFVTETTRNPSCLIINQMILDLVLEKKMTWDNVLVYHESELLTKIKSICDPLLITHHDQENIKKILLSPKASLVGTEEREFNSYIKKNLESCLSKHFKKFDDENHVDKKTKKAEEIKDDDLKKFKDAISKYKKEQEQFLTNRIDFFNKKLEGCTKKIEELNLAINDNQTKINKFKRKKDKKIIDEKARLKAIIKEQKEQKSQLEKKEKKTLENKVENLEEEKNDLQSTESNRLIDSIIRKIQYEITNGGKNKNIRTGGYLPMSPAGAVSTARKLHEKLKDKTSIEHFYSYNYDGDSSENNYALEELIKAESFIVDEWIELRAQKYKEVKITNRELIDLICEKVSSQDWYNDDGLIRPKINMPSQDDVEGFFDASSSTNEEEAETKKPFIGSEWQRLSSDANSDTNYKELLKIFNIQENSISKHGELYIINLTKDNITKHQDLIKQGRVKGIMTSDSGSSNGDASYKIKAEGISELIKFFQEKDQTSTIAVQKEDNSLKRTKPLKSPREITAKELPKAQSTLDRFFQRS